MRQEAGNRDALFDVRPTSTDGADISDTVSESWLPPSSAKSPPGGGLSIYQNQGGIFHKWKKLDTLEINIYYFTNN